MILGPEDYAQITVYEFAKAHKLPFFHFAGERRTSPQYGHLLKRKGCQRGVSDCYLPKPNDRFNSLWIELKIYPNKLTPEQKKFLEDRSSEGAYAVCCREKTPKDLADAAIEVIKRFYLL